MNNELQVPEEKGEEQRPRSDCDRPRVLTTLNLMAKGTKQACFDNELEIEEAKSILDNIKQAEEACQTGDEDYCVVLHNLMNRFTKR